MSISQEIDNKINIVELAWRYISLKKAGVNYKALCPFHNEKTASFIVSPVKNIAYCFSCHTGWWPVKFLSEIEKIPYWEALQKLAKEAWIELKTDFYKEHKENRGDFFDMHKIAANFYHEELLKDDNSKKLDYLTKRWLTIETIEKFKLWFSDDSRALFSRLINAWFIEKDIIESGIFINSSKDKFLGRITFPIYDYTGNVVAFTGRVLDDSLPKYLNSPTTKIFDKSSILFGLHLAKNEISKKWFVIIVEWQMDVISLHQAGITNTVAISGTALTEEQIKLLKRITKNIYLCLDNDGAWINATFLSLENTINEDIELRIINLGDYKDPDEYLKSGKSFDDAISSSLSLIEFYIKEWVKKHDIDTALGKKNLIKDMFGHVKKITNKIELDTILRQISRKLDISLDVLYEELKNTKTKKEEKIEILKPQRFDIYEEIVGYLVVYKYFDLFFEKFEYNLDDINDGDSYAMLKKVLLKREEFFGDSSIDFEKIKLIELFIEEENFSLNSDTITKKFLNLLDRFQKKFFQIEKSNFEEIIKKDPQNIEILNKYLELIRKGKKTGMMK